ncbi:hypothetical protein FACS1894203_5430 [Bacteroidia bacterium]|nr:hypothetical protein FACS1894203_5430 [Bacteroidia bacterium]
MSAAISCLLVLALCSFPYTVFSLWYQTFKVKKVCPLCLVVVGVLWAEMGLLIFNWSDLIFFPISPILIFLVFFGFTLPMIIWAYVKPLWKEYLRTRDFEYYYLRLRCTPNVIRAMLAKEPTLNMDFFPDEIHLGIINAPIHITVIMGLYCKPCANEWNVLIRWLTRYPGLLWLTVRFTGYNTQNIETPA